jgi:hypothetical protein
MNILPKRMDEHGKRRSRSLVENLPRKGDQIRMHRRILAFSSSHRGKEDYADMAQGTGDLATAFLSGGWGQIAGRVDLRRAGNHGLLVQLGVPVSKGH